MRKLLFFAFVATILFSCNSQKKSANSEYVNLCTTFMDALYNKKIEKVISSMDDRFTKAVKNINLDSAINVMSDELREDFGGKITSTFLSSELTTYENLPSTFLIFKIESSDKFGYYYFYIIDATKKILNVSEFSTIQLKRK